MIKGVRPRLRGSELARVLLVDDDPASRLTLQTVLEAGGYRVDSAASAAEAFSMLDRDEYELVLSEMQMESPYAGLKVLAHARMMEYKPATALICTEFASPETEEPYLLVAPEDVPGLFTKIADLISGRALRIIARQMRQANN
ncbi:MAG: response regulator [Bryobacterales bacterium]|nr:response regulator [Bryobacterales bacterium]